jgi:hypothetical protein
MKPASVYVTYTYDSGLLAVDNGVALSAAVLTIEDTITPRLFAAGIDMVYVHRDGVTRIAVTPSLDRVRVEWDGSGLASGMYLYRPTAGDFTATKKMLFLK